MKIILCGYNWSGCEALRYLTQRKNNIEIQKHVYPAPVCSERVYIFSGRLNFENSRFEDMVL